MDQRQTISFSAPINRSWPRLRLSVVFVVATFAWLIGTQTGVAQGSLFFGNRVHPLLDSPVFDSDGVTRLAGGEYFAQLWLVGVKSLPSTPRPIVDAVAFGTGDLAGYFPARGRASEIEIPDIPGGTQVTVQVRIWESRYGTNYDSAVASGSRFGISNDIELLLANATSQPAVLEGLRSFNLNGAVAPRISVQDVSVTSGAANLRFDVTLTAAASTVVTVDYATSDDTAVGNQDYLPVSGTLAFASGETNKTVTVGLINTSSGPPSRTLLFNLSNPSNGVIKTATAKGTILGSLVDAAFAARRGEFDLGVGLLAVNPDQTIVVGGRDFMGNSALVRFLSDGNVDSSFSADSELRDLGIPSNLSLGPGRQCVISTVDYFSGESTVIRLAARS